MSDTDVEMLVEFEEDDESRVNISFQHNDAKTAKASIIWPYKSGLCIICFGDRHKYERRSQIESVDGWLTIRCKCELKG
jgi:hypothetical protein